MNATISPNYSYEQFKNKFVHMNIFYHEAQCQLFCLWEEAGVPRGNTRIHGLNSLSTFGLGFNHPSVSVSPFERELTKLQREVMSAETALEQKRMARHNMLLACKIQDLPISLLVGSLDEISQVQVVRLCLKH